MTTHYIALTIDTDPDGLNTKSPDRANLVWDGLDFAMKTFHEAFPDYPLTWYVRADGQLEYAYGSLRYLFDTHAPFWQKAIARSDELGWHPHLYSIPEDKSQPEIITDSEQAAQELKRIWNKVQGVPFDLPSFRMGEAWHSSETLNLIEQLGFRVDSTAIPERDDSASGHPRNWLGTPNQPYYPDKDVPRLEGSPRNLLEVPMNSWYFQASYDAAPKLRYMNPCIHSELWQQALENWQSNLPSQEGFIWVLILHPSEAMPNNKSDLLYAHSLETVQNNLKQMERAILGLGHQIQRVTISQAATFWRQS